MVIPAVIQERRKALGLTQEQMAEYLGVTTPAVNKWEKGGTCPDIALLPPLARLLKIDLNTLFGFYKDITSREIMMFCKEVNELTLSEGFEAGFAAAQKRICEYPNSDVLLYNLALQLQGLLAAAGLSEEQSKAYMAKIDAWYERLTQSGEAVIQNGVNFMLASRAASEGQYDKAQEYLDRMPNRSDTPDKRMLQANIYLNQNRAEEAAKLLESTLLAAASDMQTVMQSLIAANLALGDSDTAAYIAERAAALAETLDLHPYTAAAAPFAVADAKKDAAQTVALLRKMLSSMSANWKAQASPLYRRVLTSSTGASMEKMAGLLLQGLKQSPEYDYLWGNEEFQTLIKEFGEKFAEE